MAASHFARGSDFLKSSRAALEPAARSETRKRMPRSTRLMDLRAQLRKMSVAFELHGEMVPLRGKTKKSTSSSGPLALSSEAARSCSAGSIAAPSSGSSAYVHFASMSM